MSKKKRTQNTFTPEIRDRAIRMVMEQQSKHSSQWAAIESISEKIGCSPQTLHSWIKKREKSNTDSGSLSSAEREQLKQLQQENKELKTANEILRKASTFFCPGGLPTGGARRAGPPAPTQVLTDELLS